LVGKEYILGGEGYAIVPFNALSEMKGNNKAIRGNGPPLRQVAHYIDVLIIFDETIIDETTYLMRGAIRGQDGDQGRGVTDGTFHKNIAVGWRRIGSGRSSCFFAAAITSADEETKGQEQQPNDGSTFHRARHQVN